MEKEVLNKLGEVMIADDAVLTIAAIAATDIKGVLCLKGDITRDNIHLADVRTLSDCVKIQNGENGVICRVYLVLDGTVSIPVVTEKIQAKVKNAIEMMTGKTVFEVDVEISGVRL